MVDGGLLVRYFRASFCASKPRPAPLTPRSLPQVREEFEKKLAELKGELRAQRLQRRARLLAVATTHVRVGVGVGVGAGAGVGVGARAGAGVGAT